MLQTPRITNHEPGAPRESVHYRDAMYWKAITTELNFKFSSFEDAKYQLEELLDELLDRFGDPPEAVQNLIAVSEIRSLAHTAYITEIRESRTEIRIILYENARLDAARFAELIGKYRGKLRFQVTAPPCFSYMKGNRVISDKEVLLLVREFAEALREYVLQ